MRPPASTCSCLSPARLLLPSPYSTLAERSIVTSGPSHAFRYLVYMIRIDIGPDEKIEVLRGRVMEVCTKIKANILDLFEASCCTRDILYPRLKVGLIFARITKICASRMGRAYPQLCAGQTPGRECTERCTRTFSSSDRNPSAVRLRNATQERRARYMPPCARSAWGRLRSAVLCRSILLSTDL